MQASSSAALPAAAPPAAQQAAHASTPSTRAEPFCLGVQYEAYYNNPTQDMPGYPPGFWSRECSPFAAMASTPIWEQQEKQQQEMQQEEEEETESSEESQRLISTGADAAGCWGYDALHMAYA